MRHFILFVGYLFKFGVEEDRGVQIIEFLLLFFKECFSGKSNSFP